MSSTGTLKRLAAGRDLPTLTLLAAITVGAALVRLLIVGQDLYADELATYWVVTAHDLPGVLSTVASDAEITPPLSFILSWAGSEIAVAPETLRLPALVAGVATIPLVFAIGVRTVGRPAALLAAALTALSPFMIFYATEARGYALMIALLLLSTLLMLQALDRGRRRLWVGYAAAACLAVYTHYTAIFVLAAQLLWALWAHPAARRPALLSSGAAAVAYLPWLPSLRADLESPTTEILSHLSPFEPAAVMFSLGHWSLGHPLDSIARLRDLPGVPALVMVGVAACIALVGLAGLRDRLPRWLAGDDRRILLVLALAAATPVGAALASAVGTNILSPRNLAGSWPYLSLAGSAVAMAGRLWQRAAVAALVLLAFAIATAKMLEPERARPDFSAAAGFSDQRRADVLVDSASLSPGPAANFDLPGARPDAAVLRLSLPEEGSRPFVVGDPLPDPAEVAHEAVALAREGPITVVVIAEDPEDLPGSARAFARTFITRVQTSADELAAALPSSYRLSEVRRFPGLTELEARVYEPRSDG